VGTIQRTLEDIAFLLRIPQRKPWGNMGADVALILKAFDNREQLLAGAVFVGEGGFVGRGGWGAGAGGV
jgi:hypothetical protein